MSGTALIVGDAVLGTDSVFVAEEILVYVPLYFSFGAWVEGSASQCEIRAVWDMADFDILDILEDSFDCEDWALTLQTFSCRDIGIPLRALRFAIFELTYIQLGRSSAPRSANC